MKKWMVFVLAFACILLMLVAGFDALEKDNRQAGMLLTFVGSMSIIGLAIDVIQHLRAGRTSN